MQCITLVQGFTGSTDAELSLPCTYDFEVAASRYLHALRDGSIPVLLLFSGTVFTRGSSGFGVEQVPWDREVRYELPVRAWRELVAQHFPGSGWLRLDHETLARFAAYKASRGHTTDDDAMADLLAAAGERARMTRPGRPRWTAHAWSPMPCCTRGTCSTPTGRVPARTSRGGSSASSDRPAPPRPGWARSPRWRAELLVRHGAGGRRSR